MERRTFLAMIPGRGGSYQVNHALEWHRERSGSPLRGHHSLMGRRALLHAAFGGLVSLPAVALAQKGRVYKIGYLGSRPAPFLLDPFLAWLRQRGWSDPTDFTMLVRHTQGLVERATALAAELISLGVDVIVTVTTPLAVEARRASTTVPIVMLTSGFPVEAGLAASLARPGGNVTGSSVFAGGVWGKYLELLKTVRPSMRRLAVAWDWVPPNILASEVKPALESFRRAADALGLTMSFQEVRTAADLDHVLTRSAGDRPDALFATSGPVHVQQRESARIVEFAAARKLPTITDFRGALFQAGILMTYSPNPARLSEKAAEYVDRILRGTRPEDLPIEQPAKFDLVINLRTTKALGLTIPPALLLRADQTIE